MKIITTSWDDGFPADFRLAELLDKYNLPGTFYIPKTNAEHTVMDEKSIAELGRKFEIGGHTLNHVRLYSNRSVVFLADEITGCFDWITALTNCKPVSFCFPGGVFSAAAIRAVQQAGFKVIRTTELLSTASTSTHNLQPTSLQLFDHPKFSYVKNTVKRNQFNNLLTWLITGAETDILKLTDFYISNIIKSGGCFHLWGHSWEIEEYQLWHKLEAVFKHISNINEFEYVQNKELVLN